MRRFVRDHYDNFYCCYFATRKMRAQKDISKLPRVEVMSRAMSGVQTLDALYSIKDLSPLERDIKTLFGAKISVTKTFVNKGPKTQGTLRWPLLLERLESDANIPRIERFGSLDTKLMRRIGFEP
jgi:hypothetical protein